MNRELAGIAIQLLKRVQITGEEVPYYNAVVNELNNIISAPAPVVKEEDKIE